jgi:phosphatidylserine decarboxylase
MVVTGIYYALVLSGVGAALGYFTRGYVGVPCYVLALFCLWFFRDPERAIPAGPVAVAPADGKVIFIKHKPEATEVCIFMNIFDVHVNRAPIAGRITDIRYRPGKFYVASEERAAIENERNTFRVEGPDTTVEFTQIAGLIARRIVSYKKPGDQVAAGERVGLIKFGSRVDVTFGPEWTVEAREGQRVQAGSSILARRKDSWAHD